MTSRPQAWPEPEAGGAVGVSEFGLPVADIERGPPPAPWRLLGTHIAVCCKH